MNDNPNGEPADEQGTEITNTVFYAAYSQPDQTVLAQVRKETYGEDIGQFSWITAEEFRRFFRLLELNASSKVLDFACGSGGPALFMAQTTCCQVTGIDINENGILAATRLAASRQLQKQAQFIHTDADGRLPAAEASYDAVVSIDAMNHLPNRSEVFAEWYRILRAGGRFPFTDATIVTGMVSRDELLARSSSMGLFLFTPLGTYEPLIANAGFVDLQIEDVTETISLVAKKWHDARARHRQDLLKTESESDFEKLQRMLGAAHQLASQRRLSRFAYFARKPGSS